MDKDETLKLALAAIESEGWCDTEIVITAIKQALAAQQEPLAWLYPEGLEALKAGKCWTAYGTKQDDNCTIPVYLNAAVAPKVEPAKAECGGFDSRPAAPVQEPAEKVDANDDDYWDDVSAMALADERELTPVQEPVAWMHEWDDGERIPMLRKREADSSDIDSDSPKSVRPLVFGDTTPPAQPAQRTEQEPVAHCEAGPEFCPVCRAETRSLALAAAVGYIQRNTPTLVWTEICNALTTTPPAAQRQWVGLTEEEIDSLHMEVKVQIMGTFDTKDIYRAIEAKLKEKNT